MKLDVIKLDGGTAGSIDLDEALFGLEPRADILHRVVRWQRALQQMHEDGSLEAILRRWLPHAPMPPIAP